jgi:BirA family transcriptional regulator, biotin operon repressor / biotin---[acetyl-CoA-carboxylase] ligase
MSAARRPTDFLPPRHFDALPSTNDEAKRLAAQGTPEGTTIWADRQTAGRGRQGRAWHSPPGNLYFSILLRPDGAPAAAAQLSFAAALAVAEAVAPLLAPPLMPRCKWPNDVLVEGRKIAGILLESEAAGATVSWLVVGIGVNIKTHPAEAETPAISLDALGAAPIQPGDLLAAIRARFWPWYEVWRSRGFAPLRAAWLDRAFALGGEIRVREARRETAGRFVDLDAAGALVLENGDGRQHISAGAVFPAG